MTSGSTLGAKPFFMAQKLTKRHFLTLWTPIFTIAVVAIATWWSWPYATRLLASSDENSPPNTEANATASVARPSAVTVMKLTEQTPRFIVQQYHGVIAARRSSILSVKSLGRVVKINADVGTAVREGEVLVELDASELNALRDQEKARHQRGMSLLEELKAGPRRQEIAQAEASVLELEAQLELNAAALQRTTKLLATSSISAQEYDEDRFAYDAMAAKLEGARQVLNQLQEGTRREQIQAQEADVAASAARISQLDVQIADAKIVAPFDGMIQQRYVDEGFVASPGQSILHLVENNALEFHVGLPPDVAQDILAQHPPQKSGLAGTAGQTIGQNSAAETAIPPRFFQITVGEKRVTAMLDRVAPAVDDSTRTQRVIFHLEIPGLEKNIFPTIAVGAAATLDIESETENAGFWVPTESLVAGSRGLWSVFVADQNLDSGQWLAQRQQVELLRAQGEWSQIRGTLEKEQSVVIGGSFRLAPGQVIEPTWRSLQVTK